MRKINLFMLFPLFASLLTGCKNGPSLQDYLKTVFFYCNLNGGQYTEDFKNDHEEGEFSGQSFRAYLNLNNYDGAVNIMPGSQDLVAPEGKVFAGWYFDEKCSIDKIITPYALHQVVMQYDQLEKKSFDVYARWIDAGTFDVVLELENTIVNSHSEINKYADHVKIDTSFTDSFVNANSNYVSGKIFRRNYAVEEFKNLKDNSTLPSRNDVKSNDAKYIFAGPALSGFLQAYDSPSFQTLDDLLYLEGCYRNIDLSWSDSLVPSKVSELSTGRQNLLILLPQYMMRPYVNIDFYTQYSLSNPYEVHIGVPAEFTAAAIARYDATLIQSQWRTGASYHVNLQITVDALNALEEEGLEALFPVKSDFELTVEDSNWETFVLGDWSILDPVYIDDVFTGYQLKSLTKENISQSLNAFGETYFQAALTADYVFGE